MWSLIQRKDDLLTSLFDGDYNEDDVTAKSEPTTSTVPILSVGIKRKRKPERIPIPPVSEYDRNAVMDIDNGY
jgi:hypothetical protein